MSKASPTAQMIPEIASVLTPACKAQNYAGVRSKNGVKQQDRRRSSNIEKWCHVKDRYHQTSKNGVKQQDRRRSSNIEKWCRRSSNIEQWCHAKDRCHQTSTNCVTHATDPVAGHLTSKNGVTPEPCQQNTTHVRHCHSEGPGECPKPRPPPK